MSNYDCIGFRTARRLAHAGYTIYCRELGTGWHFAPGTPERHIRRVIKMALNAVVTDEAFFLADYTFRARMEKWE